MCDAKERVAKAAPQNNMGAEKSEHLLRHLARKFEDFGKTVVAHCHGASFRSRRRDRWVSRVEIEEGEVAKRGKNMLGGRGSAKCANWLTVSAVKFATGVGQERYRGTLATLGGDRTRGGLADLKAPVTDRVPTFKAREKGSAQKYRGRDKDGGPM